MTEQGELDPVQSPDQESKRQPLAGVAVRETTMPSSKLFVSELVLVVTAIPPGDETEPEPVLETASDHTCTKVAVTDRASDIVTVHVPVPEQPEPDHPRNSPVPVVVAVSVTTVPSAKAFAHVPEPSTQPEIPLGLDVTYPPRPTTVTDNVFAPGGTTEKVAVTDAAAVIVTLQVEDPEQSPDQPSKMDPAAAVAVSSIMVPSS